MTLRDNFGNSYARWSFSYGSGPVGRIESGSIYPGKAVTDIVVFEVPVNKVEYLDLELPAKNGGGDGMFRIRIPASMIDQNSWFLSLGHVAPTFRGPAPAGATR